MKKNYLYLLILIGTVLYASYSHAQTKDYKSIIDNHLKKNQGKNNSKDVEWQIVSYSTAANGLVQVFGQQIHQGLPVFKAVSSYTLKNKEVVYAIDSYVQTTSTKKTITTDRGVVAAIKSASNQLRLGSAKKLEILDQVENKSYKLSPSGISLDPITAQKVFFASDNSSLKLAYTINIHTPDGKHWWSALIDAGTGNLLNLNDHLLTCNFGNHTAHHSDKNNSRKLSLNTSKSSNANSLLAGERYLVFPLPLESPAEGNQQVVTEPQNLTASPFGWHDDDGEEGADYTITRGNNVYAFLLEPDFSIGDSPNGGADLNFDFPFAADSQPQEYTDASLTNLFFINNKVHDILYFYGFDEAGGNFQANNYGRGRTEVVNGNTETIGDGDPVFASGQDINGFNNATFGTDPDGDIAIMRMFLWSAVGDAGQPLTISSPAALAGPYTGYPADFGPSLPQAAINAALVLGRDDNSGESADAFDGCDPLTNASALNNKIAVFRRGGCNFTEKVILAQNAGALAVIIVNNVDDPIIQMGGSDPEITIPSIMISKADGDQIIEALRASTTINGSLFDVGPYRKDGSLDNVIIVHEYGHGVSMRLTGGPDTVDCLETCTRRDDDGNCIAITYTEQMGEGWSDYLGLLLTMQDSDTPEQSRPIGNYVVQGENETIGIRPFPYSTDLSVNPVTYGDTNDNTQFSAPHGVGSVWASMLWDLTWDLIDIYGFTNDVYLSEGGNTISLKLVMQAMKMQPCQPGFVDGRDAILAADEVLYDGKHACLIWKAFARRGLGVNASQGEATSRLDQIENFDVPEEFQGNCTLSLGEIEDIGEAFFLFPNPSRGQVNVFINGNFGEGNITVFDLSGRKVLTQKHVLSDQIEINTSSLSQGVYILQVKNDKVSASRKLIIN
ncbi:T9SS-dependent M36 family metallopeptidase [Leeuwenhoekiella nanhaiensis]|uniref:Peptidase n=1 Tax=Leeuwenhoekiella nanhaiensis TaxID=1655491 RepID=A0A2G1VWE6_9FLAO|nr:T9SS-dependent M36 family metallopeptidase [Leeuwenhoekiella nanhaiensis]PHQ31075.1 hypothetical protein CJ305_02295 [Leeuwenhoekiella nanhaiensis]